MIQKYNVIGYGFQGDRSFNQEGYLFHPNDFSSDGLIDYLSRSNIDTISIEYIGNVNLSDIVYYKDGILCVVPPSLIKEAVHTEDDCEIKSSIVQSLEKGLPGCNFKMDDRNGHKLPLTLCYMFMMLYKKYVALQSDAERFGMEYQLIEMADELGFRNTDEALKHLAPWIPDVVVLTCEYLRIFTNKEDMWTMRPMAFIFWKNV